MIAGVVLAAGEGSRFVASADGGSLGHKLTVPFRGRPLSAWALEAAAGAGFNQLLVVTGAVDLTDLITDAVGDAATILHNPDWAAGQATSLAVAVAAARAAGHRAVVVGLADQPLIPTAAWRAVGAAAGDIVTATFGGKQRPPVKLERTVWDDLPTAGDVGARTLMQLRPELVSELPCKGNPVDIDTVEDLQRWS
ncbi:MAG: NTP transferase domain-containing protein [Actinomycetota bacterium]